MDGDDTMITALPASYDSYIRLGWSLVPIPPGTKGPRNTGWNRKENALTSGAALPPGYGVGIGHAYSSTMALDIDDWPTAKELLAAEGVDLDGLYAAHDAVAIVSGVKGHGKLLYKMPFGMTLPTKKVSLRKDGVDTVAYELRCATINGLTMQDVIPPSIHPITQQPYTWAGRGKYTELPTCPIELLGVWESLINKDRRKVIKVHAQQATSWDEIKAALWSISADCSREKWIQIGMALHSAAAQDDKDDVAYVIWDEWSAQSATKYKGPADTAAQWRSFRVNEDGVTIGTLFHHARQAGWFRAAPDASQLFGEVAPSTPSVVTSYLLPPPPQADLSVWPQALVARAVEISKTRGLDPLVPLMAGIAAVCGAVDARMRLELMHEYEVPPILWIATIGEPSDKKSPGSKPMFDVLTQIEQSDRDKHKAEMLIWEGKEAAYAAAKKDYLDAAKTGPGGNDVVVNVPDLPPQPQALKLVVSDITSQKLIRNASTRPYGLLCYLDEMNGWVSKLTDRTGVDDRSTWVQGYEASAYRYERVSLADSIICEHYALSIYGNIQPEVLRVNLRSLAVDGLIQRFIPVVLRDEFRKRGDPIPECLSGKSLYDDLIRTIHSLPVRKYTLTEGAYSAFRDFQQYIVDLVGDERLLNSGNTYMTALGKVEGMCARLALVFHLINDPYAAQLGAETMIHAIDAAKHYVIPSMRYVYNVLSGAATDSLDLWVIDYVIQYAGEVQSISLSEIKRSARRQADKSTNLDTDVRSVMDWLQSQGWVAMVEETRRNTVWTINPKLADVFKDRRMAVIGAKQRVKNNIVQSAMERHGGLKPEATRHVVGYRQGMTI